MCELTAFSDTRCSSLTSYYDLLVGLAALHVLTLQPEAHRLTVESAPG